MTNTCMSGNNCKSCGMDMDMEPYCVRPEVIKLCEDDTKRKFSYGLNVNGAYSYCKGVFYENREP